MWTGASYQLYARVGDILSLLAMVASALPRMRFVGYKVQERV